MFRYAVPLAVLVLARGASAETPADLYAHCMAEARTHPADALAIARGWKGPSAAHCEAVALLGLGRYGEAAARLRHLAREGAEPALRAGLLAQAGQALLLDNQPEEAESVLTQALEVRPADPALLTDRGVARAEQFRYADAVKDFNRAIEGAPDAADAYLFRASALRMLDKLALALSDVERALVLNPRSPDALLERGILRRLTGDRYGARADWQAVVTEWPDAPAAVAAADNIGLLDRPPEKQPPENQAPQQAAPAQ